jgi:hypothetical protein
MDTKQTQEEFERAIAATIEDEQLDFYPGTPAVALARAPSSSTSSVQGLSSL